MSPGPNVLGTGGTATQREGPNDAAQGDKHAIGADPTNPNVVYVSGDNSNEMIVRGDTTEARGGVPSRQWVSISSGGATNNTRPRAESRHLTFDGSGNLRAPPACAPHCAQGSPCAGNDECGSTVCTNNARVPPPCSGHCRPGLGRCPHDHAPGTFGAGSGAEAL